MWEHQIIQLTDCQRRTVGTMTGTLMGLLLTLAMSRLAGAGVARAVDLVEMINRSCSDVHAHIAVCRKSTRKPSGWCRR